MPIKASSKEALQDVLNDLLKASEELPELKQFLETESAERELLLASMTLSPYLCNIAIYHPQCVVTTIGSPPQELLDELVESARNAWKDCQNQAELMSTLRRLKRQLAFSLALYDLGRILETSVITAWLSAFARASVSSTIDYLLLTAHNNGKLALRDVENPSTGSGLTVIGMGKLGSSELNYSSDIDLVVVFDPRADIVKDWDEATEVFSRIVRQLIHILQERTGDGYVFRTDLRLRPDPGSTPLALPYDAALHYYEGRGQNWERAAYIKADVAAGDLRIGSAFCTELTPFIYRKYLDYVAITDIHSIKRQIHAHKGFGEISVYGHNIKLGRGGIREIEFFVQTQQLIAGGRMPALRTRSTDKTLAALAEAQWIADRTEESLRNAYWFLRDVEHRIQMRRDEQSHVLPESEEEFACIALMMGFEEPSAFAKKLLATLRLVEKHYARLFENEKGLTSGAGNLVFTGDDDDPGTLETLSQMGFERPSDMSRVIRTWHYGRYRATQTPVARKRLTELMPELLQTFADTGRADETLLKFDSFLAGLPSGIQLFALLGNNAGLMSLLVTIMASAPRLAQVIARKPHVFDGMLDPTLLAELPTRERLSEQLEAFLDGELDYEEVLDRLRIFAAEQRFLVGVRLITGAIAGDRAAIAFTDLADLTLNAAIGAVQAELEKAHGRIAGGRVAVVGLGKFGSREMSAASDIDMILLYTHDPECQESDGARPIDPVRYYARLTQRLISALSAPTAEGVLYEVDLRLRPSGNKGPVATHIRAFRKYQKDEAWTWEHLALTRARIVAGDPELKAQAEQVFADVLAQERDIDKTASDVADMRKRIEEEKPPVNIWDLKLVPGGLFDIEFITQFLRLHSARLDRDSLELGSQTKDILEALGPSMIGEDAAATLVEALTFYTRITQIIRLCLEGKFEPDDSPQGFKELMLRVVDYPDMGTLEAHLKETSSDVRAIFDRTIVDRQLL
ncbi:MAG: bifunctional [glutamine synthetase] adenylyltransferase/[glutamine synthetase]-adenylyl-L-tyrosine phosphorylase [Hyphomicrobiales bacterium]|nr:bifunctional [glutamine synthetase] adenylyltransferase/[glutamine synthetase]-adenylyl-L-tyrosine phosphorylase [Hyphomicrobiales bacterium]MCP4998413.1 bifunctional [glutamine synthetase] adenylyltransferase/[glutamine synthetase]-adenylyl-L-tyrosine phosphorylase [Hyphomicrobiales bacterium]